MGNVVTVVAYLGPETMLPMTSVLAGVAGVVMMFGRAGWNWTKGAYKQATSSTRAKPASKLRKIGNGPILRVNSGHLQRDRVEA